MKKRNRVYKQIAFDTAVRNPERYVEFLKIISKYEGKILSDEIILDIVVDFYKEGIVSSPKIESVDKENSDLFRQTVVDLNSTRKPDGGFPKGYCSRLWTYMRTPSEFGFVYVRYKEELKVSFVLKLYLEGQIDEQQLYFIQSFKYNRMSPFRRVLNDFNYFEFISEVLDGLDNEGLSYNEFIVSTLAETGAVDNFIELIKNEKVMINNNLEMFLKKYYYSYVNSDNAMKRVTKEYPDVVLRVLKITGRIIIKYSYKKIIIFSDDFISETRRDVLSNMKTETLPVEDYKEYYDYMNRNESIIPVIAKVNQKPVTSSNVKLKEYIDVYELTLKELKEELNKLSAGKKSQNIKFKYIPAPLRLEFLVSLLLTYKQGNTHQIKPNYKMDSIGAPITHAPSRNADIEVYSNNGTDYLAVEVTLLRSRVQQLNNETTNLIRHIEKTKTEDVNTYLAFVAPKVHIDTENYLKYSILAHRDEFKSLSIKGFSISEFSDLVINDELYDEIDVYSKNHLERIGIVN